jgi:O-antigen ligase
MRQPGTRLCVWLSCLAIVALLTQAVVSAHLVRMRGLPDGFPAPVAGADVPALGANVALEQYEEAGLTDVLARAEGGGFTWLRQPFSRSRLELQPGTFDWTTPDRIVDALARHPRLQLVAVLDDDTPPVDPDLFAAFAAAFAGRYGEQVDVYQVWDEPNLASRWGGGPVSPAAYADLLARTAAAIRAADGNATILLAGLAPTVETGPQNLSDVRYLEQLYLAGASADFDLVAGKPYGFDTGPDDRRVDESVLNFSRLILLREVMVAHGDEGKAVWASHWGWNVLPPGWSGSLSIWGQTDEETQAAHTVAALERARLKWPWCGALILDHLQPAAPHDDPRWGFALLGQDGDPRPVYQGAAAWAGALVDAAPPGGYPALTCWASYEGDWRVGPLGADAGRDGERATFRFDGTSVALTVRRGPYRAFLGVSVDGKPANALPRDEAGRAYLVLYDREPAAATIPLATGLAPGPHTVEVTAEGGQGQWALVDWRVGVAPVDDGYAWQTAGLALAGLLLAALALRDARRVGWAALGRALRGWPEWGQVALPAGVTGLLWFSAGMSWGRDWSSPWLVVSVLALPVLTALFAARIDVGLALVACAAPFHLHPGNLYYRALGLPEVLVLLCGLATAVRAMAAPRRRRAGAGLSLVDASVLLLLLAALVAGAAAGDLRAALFELRVVFVLPALYYLLLRAARFENGEEWRVVDGLVLGGTGVAAVGLVQLVLGRNLVTAEGGLLRVQSVYFSPNNVGLYLGRVWPFLLAIALRGQRGHRRLLYGLALVPVTLALVASFSKGALLLAVPAALVAMAWRAGGRYRWAAPALVVGGVLALIPLLRIPRFASLLDLEQGSSFFRLELWRSSATLLRERPWFGAGPGNFPGAFRTRYVLPSAWQEFNLEHPHNVFVDHWTRMGLLGPVAGIVAQVAFWRAVRGRSATDALALGLVGSGAALLAHGLVDNTLFFPDLALTFSLSLALAQPRQHASTRLARAPVSEPQSHPRRA